MMLNLPLLVSTTTLVITMIYYYNMVVLTQRSAEASLFNTLYAEYGNPQMVQSIRAVEEFRDTHQLTPEQIQCRQPGEVLWERSFDDDWQRLLHWYQKVVYFHRMGLLKDRFYVEFPGKMRARHFVEHVEPFAKSSCYLYQEKNCSDVFDYLRKLYDLPAPPKVSCKADDKKKKKKKKTKDKKQQKETNEKEEL